MKSNRLLKWLMVPLLLVLGFVLLKLLSPERAGPGSDARPDALTPEEMKALGIEGDTPRDTVATLVAQVKQLRAELQTAMHDNKNQKADNERLRQREQGIDQRIQQALDSERDRLHEERSSIASDQQQTQGLLSELQRRLDSMGQPGGGVDLPIGLGLHEGDGEAFKRDEVRWIEPATRSPLMLESPTLAVPVSACSGWKGRPTHSPLRGPRPSAWPATRPSTRYPPTAR